MILFIFKWPPFNMTKKGNIEDELQLTVLPIPGPSPSVRKYEHYFSIGASAIDPFIEAKGSSI